jgi:hypothetical protein
VLCAGANIHEQIPFASTAPTDFHVHGNSIQGDAWRQHGTWQRMQFDAARSGEFRFWNPFEYLGMPFHGNGQTALFHPYSWPYYFAEPNLVRGPLAGLRLLVSAVAMFVLLRRWQFTGPAAFVGGLIWIFAPFNIRWLHWPLSHSSLWLPVLMLSLDAFVCTPTGRLFAGACLSATVLQLSGHPETQFQAGLAAGATLLLRMWGLALPLRVQFVRVLGCFLIMIVGVLGASAQLLPFLVQLPESADWVKHIHASPDGMEPRGLALFLAHDFWGRPRAGNGYEGPANYIEAGVGMGILPLVLALTGIFAAIFSSRFDRMVRIAILGSGFLAILFLAFIFDMPGVEDAFMKLPLFDQANRYRWTLATGFWISVAAAGGFQIILACRRWGGIPALVLVLTALVGLSVLLSGRVPARFSKIKTAFRQPHWRTVYHHPAVQAALALSLATGGAVWLVHRNRRHGVISGLGFTCWIGAEAFVGAWDFNATAPMEIADPKPTPMLTQAMALAGPFRMTATNEVLYPNMCARYGFRDVSGYDWPLPLQLETVLSKLGWRVVEGTSLPRSAVVPSPSPSLAAFLSRCSVKVIYTDLRQAALKVGSAEWKQVALGASADAVYLNPNPLPRVRFPEKIRSGTPEEAIAALIDPDLSNESVVVGADRPISNGSGEAQIIHDGFETVEIQVQCSKGGVLVLADRWAPGWHVTVDGNPAHGFAVDHLFRGVVVESGSHRVTWHYDPPGFWLGVWLSGMGFFIIACTWILDLLGIPPFRPSKM